MDADFIYSGGLSTSGSPNSGCSSSTGQVYIRSGTYNGAYAIMYSWYMPKDSPSSGLGHRHEWENVVVWLSGQSESASLRGVAISAHGTYIPGVGKGRDVLGFDLANEIKGEYQKYTAPPLAGTRPKIGYISIWPVNHQLIATVSLQLPLPSPTYAEADCDVRTGQAGRRAAGYCVGEHDSCGSERD